MSILSSVKNAMDLMGGSELERKVKQATSNENWGAPTSLQRDIAQATFDYEGYKQVMPLIWKRMSQDNKEWRIVFKSLMLLDYLLRNGSDKVVQEARDRIYTVKTLMDFTHIEEGTNKDRGAGVREKAKQIVDLMNDKERLGNERELARKTRDKYKGISNTSMGSGGSSRPYDPDYRSGGGSSGGGGGGGGGNDWGLSESQGAFTDGDFGSKNFAEETTTTEAPKKKKKKKTKETSDDEQEEAPKKKTTEEAPKKKKKPKAVEAAPAAAPAAKSSSKSAAKTVAPPAGFTEDPFKDDDFDNAFGESDQDWAAFDKAPSKAAAPAPAPAAARPAPAKPQPQRALISESPDPLDFLEQSMGQVSVAPQPAKKAAPPVVEFNVFDDPLPNEDRGNDFDLINSTATAQKSSPTKKNAKANDEVFTDFMSGNEEAQKPKRSGDIWESGLVDLDLAKAPEKPKKIETSRSTGPVIDLGPRYGNKAAYGDLLGGSAPSAPAPQLPPFGGPPRGGPAPMGFGGPAPMGFGAPAPMGFGAPAPMGFGAPGGFGAPAPMGFGAPAPGGFGGQPGFGFPPAGQPQQRQSFF